MSHQIGGSFLRFMSLISKIKTWVDNDLVLYTDINGNFDNVYNLVNGQLDDTNIKANAGIAKSKLDSTLVDTNTAQAITGKKQFTATSGTIVTDSDAATITFDLSTGNVHTVSLAGNRTLALTNVTVGQSFVIRLAQDATGSRTVTWFSGIKWPYGVVPTLTTTASKTDSFGFICTASGAYDGYIIGQSL